MSNLLPSCILMYLKIALLQQRALAPNSEKNFSKIAENEKSIEIICWNFFIEIGYFSSKTAIFSLQFAFFIENGYFFIKNGYFPSKTAIFSLQFAIFIENGYFLSKTAIFHRKRLFLIESGYFSLQLAIFHWNLLFFIKNGYFSLEMAIFWAFHVVFGFSRKFTVTESKAVYLSLLSTISSILKRYHNCIRSRHDYTFDGSINLLYQDSNGLPSPKTS